LFQQAIFFGLIFIYVSLDYTVYIQKDYELLGIAILVIHNIVCLVINFFYLRAIKNAISNFFTYEKYKINDIYEAEDGNSAFKTFSDVLPDLVLLDINIPFKDGLTLAQEMKEIKHDVKIAIISGYDYFEYAQKALKIGVEDYILKPVSKSDINEIISKLIYSLEEDKKYNEARKIIFSKT